MATYTVDFAAVAAKMVSMGAFVVPAEPGTKICKLPDWQNEATQDWIKIANWSNQNRHYNVCVVGKPVVGALWGFDDDSGVLAQYEAQHGAINTYRVRTVSGKTQLLFKHNQASIDMGNLSAKDANGCERWSARCKDRYVISAGSQAHPHNDPTQPLTPYSAIDTTSPIEAPAQFIEFLKQNAGLKKQEQKASAETKTVHEGGRNNYLTSYLGTLRQTMAMDKEQLLSAGLLENQKSCVPPLSESEVAVIVGSIANYPIKTSGEVLIGGVPVGSPAPAQADLSWLEVSEIKPRPEFPRWILNDTSLYEGLAKPISDANSKYPELIWLPAVQVMLNYMHNRVVIQGFKRTNVNMILGIISPPGKFFKSSSCAAGHEYFQQMGLCSNLTMGLRNAENKVVIGQAGSSEGFALLLDKANAKHAILFNDELGKLVSKAGIENSSLPHDLLTWYESGDFGNQIKNVKQSFSFPAGTYCFGWQFCTTTRGFNSQWPRIAGISSGMPDRAFFLLTPKEPKPMLNEVYVNTLEASAKTHELLNKAVIQKGYPIAEYLVKSAEEKAAAFGDPRSMNMVYKFALYFAVDLGLDEIDEDCMSRALALVEYRQRAMEYLAPIEAKNDEGRLLNEIIREIKQYGGKMSKRILYQNLNADRYGERFWNMVYKGGIGGQYYREFTEPGKRGQTKQMVGIVKDDIRFGPEE